MCKYDSHRGKAVSTLVDTSSISGSHLLPEPLASRQTDSEGYDRWTLHWGKPQALCLYTYVYVRKESRDRVQLKSETYQDANPEAERTAVSSALCTESYSASCTVLVAFTSSQAGIADNERHAKRTSLVGSLDGVMVLSDRPPSSCDGGFVSHGTKPTVTGARLRIPKFDPSAKVYSCSNV